MVGARTSVGWSMRLMISKPNTVFPEPGAATMWTRLSSRYPVTRSSFEGLCSHVYKELSLWQNRAYRAPAPDFAASSRRACVPPFLRLDLIFREPYLAEAVTSLNVGIEGHHYSCGPQVTA